MVMTREKKVRYFERLTELALAYPKILIVTGDNVSSNQFAEVRRNLRGKAIMLFGKNTMVRTCLRKVLDQRPGLQNLIDLMVQNVGLIFCLDDPAEIKKIVTENRLPAAARQGAIAPVDVRIPAGPTILDPSQTSFFQALGINTKIVKSKIELVAEVHIIKKGTRVTASQAALLQKLNLKPFEYGIDAVSVYDDGEVYPAAALDITLDDIKKDFMETVSGNAAASLALDRPTRTSIPHFLIKAYKDVVSIALAADHSFPRLEKIKDAINNAAAAPVAAAAAAPAAAAAAAPVEEEEEEEEMEFDLF